MAARWAGITAGGVLSSLMLSAYSFTSRGMAQAAASAPRVITVTGDAEMRVVPDEVVITFGVDTDDKEMAQAKRRNDQILQQVIALAKSVGVEARAIQTDYVNIEPQYNYPSGGNRTLRGYRVYRSVVITLKALTQFDALLSGALEKGVTNVHNIQFRTTALRTHRDNARDLAIKAAQEKAQALAGALNQSIGDPVLIQEEKNQVQSWYGWGWGRGSNAMTQNVIVESGPTTTEMEGGMAPGQITVRAQVSVTFELR